MTNLVLWYIILSAVAASALDMWDFCKKDDITAGDRISTIIACIFVGMIGPFLLPVIIFTIAFKKLHEDK